MAAQLKWKGDELFLGKTKMAEVRVRLGGGVSVEHFYVLGPKDFVSEPYKEKSTARQECWKHVCDLLVKAGA